MSNWDDFDIDVYILDDEHHTVKVSLLEWAKWFGTHDRRVAFDQTKFHEVSTVFLGNDMNWSGKGPPILFETMTFERGATIREFGGKLFPARESVDIMWRYASWDDAVAGHNAILKRLRKQEADALSAGIPATGSATKSR